MFHDCFKLHSAPELIAKQLPKSIAGFATFVTSSRLRHMPSSRPYGKFMVVTTGSLENILSFAMYLHIVTVAAACCRQSWVKQ